MSKKYVISRKDVCAGQLLKSEEVLYRAYDCVGKKEVTQEELAKQGINFSVFSGLIFRPMLFNVNDNGLANDLIYTTPTSYPIKDMNANVSVDGEFIIDSYVELEELLKYLKYGVDLTQDDLNKIYRKLITNRYWLNHNKELFGLIKCGYGQYFGGGTQILPSEIYENLSHINCCTNGKPHEEEPGYSLIKRKK